MRPTAPEVSTVDRDSAYYRHSGRVGPIGALLAVAAALATAAVVGSIGGIFKLIGTYFVDRRTEETQVLLRRL